MTSTRRKIIESEVRAHLGGVVKVEGVDAGRVEHMARDIVRRLDAHDAIGGRPDAGEG